MQFAIERSCINKAEIVANDETEQEQRALLNFGHTFAHAIETGMNYQGWLHGEAVGLGMLMAAEMSYREGGILKEELDRISNILSVAGLPMTLPTQLANSGMRELMSVDKKAKDGKLVLVLLKGIGEAIVTNQFDENKLGLTLAQFSSNAGLN